MMEEIIIPIHKQMAQLNIGKSPFDPPEVMCEFEKPPSTQKPEMDRPRTSETPRAEMRPAAARREAGEERERG